MEMKLPTSARECEIWLTPVSGRRRPIATAPRLIGGISSDATGFVFAGQFGTDIRFSTPAGETRDAYVIVCPQTESGQLSPGEASSALVLLNAMDVEIADLPGGHILELREGPVLTGLLRLGSRSISIDSTDQHRT